MYAKTWDEFGGMARGIVAFAGRETHRSDVVQEWENFQRWLVQKHSNLIPDDDQGDVLNLLRSQCDTDEEAFVMCGRLYRDFMNA